MRVELQVLAQVRQVQSGWRAGTPAMQRDQRRLESCWALKADVRRRDRSSCRKAAAMGRPTHRKEAYAHRMLLMCCSDSSCTPHTAACSITQQPLGTRR